MPQRRKSCLLIAVIDSGDAGPEAYRENMNKYLETKICQIADPDFQSMIGELCICIDVPAGEFVNKTLAFLLMVIVKEKKRLTQLHIPTSRVLSTKVNKLSPDSVVYRVCRELVDLKKTTHIECYDGKTVLTLIKQTHQSVCPPLHRRKPSTRRQRAY